MEHINNLHIGDSNPNPGSCRPKKGRTQSGELPKFPKDFSLFVWKTT
jgi:hypothetical protein